jgi:hypothetical protein
MYYSSQKGGNTSMYIHPGEAEEAERQATYRKFGLKIPRTTMAGKQLIILFVVIGAVCVVCRLLFG